MRSTTGSIPLRKATEPLTQDAYKPYGAVVSVRDDLTPTSANQGTAERFNGLGALENLRESAHANLCVFRSSAYLEDVFVIRLLERHAYSTQLFVPMNCMRRYLVIVCAGADEPDLSTLRAFIAKPNQGVTYAPGTWHHPLIALDQATDFACVVWEDGSSQDCDVRRLAAPIEVPLKT